MIPSSDDPISAAQSIATCPAVRTRPLRSFATVFTLIAATLAFTVGCTNGQNDASNYDDTEEAFLDGCVSIAGSDNDAVRADGPGADSETRISSPTTYCRCVFDEIRETVPFADFKKINSTMRDEGGALPSGFRDAYRSCDPSATADAE